MELEEIKNELQIIGKALVLKTKSLKCYLFGSILTNAKLANDIDILIIYENENQVELLKQEFKILSTIYPLHISYFTFCEEQEFDFIKQQKAQEIFSI